LLLNSEQLSGLLTDDKGLQGLVATVLNQVLEAQVTGCDRAIPNPNRLVKSFAYKINCLLKNIVWLYKPSSHANVLDAGP
jgi:hypothetical protein